MALFLSASGTMAEVGMVIDRGESITQATNRAIQACRNDFDDYNLATQHPEHYLSVHERRGPMRRMDGDTLSPAREQLIEAKFEFFTVESRWKKDGVPICYEGDLFIWFCLILSRWTERSVRPLGRKLFARYEGILYPDVVKILELWEKHNMDRWFPGHDGNEESEEDELPNEEADAGERPSSNDRDEDDDHHDDQDEDDANESSSASSSPLSSIIGSDLSQTLSPPPSFAPNNTTRAEHPSFSLNDDTGAISPLHLSSSITEGDGRGDGQSPSPDDDNEQSPLSDPSSPCPPPKSDSRVHLASSRLTEGIELAPPSDVFSSSANQGTRADLASSSLSEGNEPIPPSDSSSSLANTSANVNVASSDISEGNEPPVPSKSPSSSARNRSKAELVSLGLSEGNEPGPLLHSSSSPYISSSIMDSTPPSSTTTAMPRSTTTESSLSHIENTTATEPLIDPTPSSSAHPTAPTSSPSSPAAKTVNEFHPKPLFSDLLSVGTSGINGGPVWFGWMKPPDGKEDRLLFYHDDLGMMTKEQLKIKWHEHLELDKFEGNAREKNISRRNHCRQIIQEHTDALKKAKEEEAAAKKVKNDADKAKREATRQAKLTSKKRPREAEDSEKTLLGRTQERAEPKAKRQRRNSNVTIVVPPRSPCRTRSQATNIASKTLAIQSERSPARKATKETAENPAGVTSATTTNTTSATSNNANERRLPSEDSEQTVADYNQVSSPTTTMDEQTRANLAKVLLAAMARDASNQTAESHQSGPVNHIQHLVRKRRQPAEEEEQSPLNVGEQQSAPITDTTTQADITSVSGALSPFDQDRHPAWLAHPSDQGQMQPEHAHSAVSSVQQPTTQYVDPSSSNTAAPEQSQDSLAAPYLSSGGRTDERTISPVRRNISGMSTNILAPAQKRPRPAEDTEQPEDSKAGILTPKAKKQKHEHHGPDLAPPSSRAATPLRSESLLAPSRSSTPASLASMTYSPESSPSPVSPTYSPESSPSPTSPTFPIDDSQPTSPLQEAIYPAVAQSFAAPSSPTLPAGNMQPASSSPRPAFPAVNIMQAASSIHPTFFPAVNTMQQAGQKRPRLDKGYYVSSASTEDDEEDASPPDAKKQRLTEKPTAPAYKLDPRAPGYVPRTTISQPIGSAFRNYMRGTALKGRSPPRPAFSSFASANNGITTAVDPSIASGTNVTATGDNVSSSSTKAGPSTNNAETLGANTTPASIDAGSASNLNADAGPISNVAEVNGAGTTSSIIYTGSAFATASASNSVADNSVVDDSVAKTAAAGPTTAGSNDIPLKSPTNANAITTAAATSAANPTTASSSVMPTANIANMTADATPAVGPTIADSTSTPSTAMANMAKAAPDSGTAGNGTASSPNFAANVAPSTTAAGPTIAGSSSNNATLAAPPAAVPNLSLLSARPVPQPIKLEPLSHTITSRTSLHVTASHTPTMGPVVIPLTQCPDLETFFSTIISEYEIVSEQPIRKASVTLGWNGKRQLLRREREGDWRIFEESVRRGWSAVDGEAEEGGQVEREIEVLVHVE